MTNIIKLSTGRTLLRNRAKNELAAIANSPEIQDTELSYALARLVESMDKNNLNRSKNSERRNTKSN